MNYVSNKLYEIGEPWKFVKSTPEVPFPSTRDRWKEKRINVL